jgi:hypothetical protein
MKWTIPLIAILVGALYVAPQFLIRQKLLSDNKPFVLSQFFYTSDEAHNYLQRDREVLDGGFPAKDLFFNDDRPNIFPMLPAVVFTPFLTIAGDLNIAYLLLSFVLPAALFLVFYLLGLVIFERDRLWSALFGLIGTLTPMAIHMPRAFLHPANFLNIVVKNFYPGINTLLDRIFLNRIDDPLITFLFYIPAIAFLWLFWHHSKKKFAFWAGVFAAALFYVYFHYWIYWLIVLGLLLSIAWWQRRPQPERWRGMLILFAVLLIISVPYWINYFRFSGFPGADEYAQRIGIEEGRFIRWQYIVPDYLAYLVLGGLIYFALWKKGKRETALLCWVFLAAILIAWNIQLVTGFIPQPGHFRKAISPVYLLMVFYLVFQYCRSLNPKKLGIVLLSLSLLLVAKKMVNVAAFVSPPEKYLTTYTQPNNLVDSWRWLSQNLPKQASIAGLSFQTSIKLSAFTALRPYLPWSGITLGTNREIENRYLNINKAFGVSAVMLEKRLRENTDDDHINLYNKYFTDRGIENIPEEKISDLLGRYRSLAASFRDLGVDYVYYGPDDRKISAIDLSANKNLELVYRQDGIEIYAVIRN